MRRDFLLTALVFLFLPGCEDRPVDLDAAALSAPLRQSATPATDASVGALPIDGPWSTAEVDYEGHPMVVRRNDGYRKLGKIGGYEHQAAIAIRLNEPDAAGMPAAEEEKRLKDVESQVRAALEDKAESLLVVVLTTVGTRELVFYTRAPEDVRQRFEKLRSAIKGHEMQLMLQPDPDWVFYSQLSESRTGV